MRASRALLQDFLRCRTHSPRNMLRRTNDNLPSFVHMDDNGAICKIYSQQSDCDRYKRFDHIGCIAQKLCSRHKMSLRMLYNSLHAPGSSISRIFFYCSQNMCKRKHISYNGGYHIYRKVHYRRKIYTASGHTRPYAVYSRCTMTYDNTRNFPSPHIFHIYIDCIHHSYRQLDSLCTDCFRKYSIGRNSYSRRRTIPYKLDTDESFEDSWLSYKSSDCTENNELMSFQTCSKRAAVFLLQSGDCSSSSEFLWLAPASPLGECERNHKRLASRFHFLQP